MTGIRPLIQASRLFAALALAGLVAACSPSAAPRVPAPAEAPAPDPNPGYLPPPEARAVSSQGGVQRLSGVAVPGAQVRLTAIPSRRQTVATAAADGEFRFNLAGAGQPRLYALAMIVAGTDERPRLVQAESYLFVSPEGRGTLLRAGAGAIALRPPSGPLRIAALDYDRAGGATLSGVARPGEQLIVRVDGVTRGQSRAHAESGRFNIALEPVQPGAHQFVASGQRNASTLATTISNPAPLTHGVFRAERTAFGWRIDWTTPSGGLQTTLIID